MKDAVRDFLMEQLHDFLTPATDVSVKRGGGAIHLDIDLTKLNEPTKSHVFNVDYRSELGGHPLSMQVRFNPTFNVVGAATVTRLSDNVFVFTGPIVVVAAGVDGGNLKKGGRSIACGGHGDNTVTVTVSQSS